MIIIKMMNTKLKNNNIFQIIKNKVGIMIMRYLIYTEGLNYDKEKEQLIK